MLADIRDYLEEFCDWDEVLLKDEIRVMPLALGLNPAWHGDWTTVGTLKSRLDEFFSWEGLSIHARNGNYHVIGLESGEEPTLIVETM